MNVAKGWYPYIGGGTWPDCDMIPLGRISIRGERGAERNTRLTEDEQYSLMTLFTILRSPLMFGGDLPSIDEFTTSLLTNEEVLRMHREGSQVRELKDFGGILSITSVNGVSGDVYLAVFNRNNDEAAFSVSMEELGLGGKAHKAVSLWDGQKTGRVKELAGTLRGHACVLYKIDRN